jgi:heme-degrading monooxygenase HmoA
MEAMVAIMWQFTVKEGRDAEFEEFFGGDGDWNVMNRRTRSFLGSSFLRDQNTPSRYIVIEYWSEMLVYEHHRSYRSDEMAVLEERRAALAESVEPLGVFTALNVPDRSGPTWSQRR